MISNRDLLSFHQALLDLYAPGLDLENFPERSLHFLTSIADSDLAVSGRREVGRKGATISLQVDRLLPGLEKTIEPFGLLAPKYPWFCADPRTRDGKPHYRSEFYSDRQYRSLDIHSEIFQRWGHENYMTMCIDAGPHEVIFFGTSRGKRDYSWKERELMKHAQGHLIGARQLAVRLSAAKPWSVSPGIFSRQGFTPRESDVLYWLTEGKSNVEIAMILHIELATVKGYLTSIFNKTGTSNRLAATLHAVELARQFHERQPLPKESPFLLRGPLGPPPTKVG